MAKESNVVQKIGSWAFMIGVIIAVIAGFWQLGMVWTAILVILGLIVGFLNVTGKETMPFLMATVSLVIVARFAGDLPGLNDVSPVLGSIFRALVIFVVPSTIVVALKAIYALASDE
jgi:hypothetical protein